MKKAIVLKFLLVVGMIISLYLLYDHFTLDNGGTCSFGGSSGCDSVNRSVYANFEGLFYLLNVVFGLGMIPLIQIANKNLFLDFITAQAFLGFLGLLIVFLMVSYKDERFLFIKKGKVVSWIRWLLGFGVLYGVYMFLIQAFLIKDYCLFCILLDLVMISCFLISLRMK